MHKVSRAERYTFHEKDRGRIVSFNENFYADKSAYVEEIIIRQHLHKALAQALDELNDSEKKIIDECFFSEKRTFTELATQHGISRAGYMKKLTFILRKLRKLIENSYEIF